MDVAGRITTERRGHLLLMGVDRVPKRNAFTVAMYQELAQAYGELDRDPELRCGVLFANGEHFTAGLDLPDWVAPFMGGRLPLPEGACDPFALYGRACSKPVVFAAQGLCLTIGLELMLATDIRVAARGTRFAQIEVKRAIYPVGGATLRLPAAIGWANAMRYLLTGDEISAEEALRLGLVQELTEPGEQLDRAVALAERVAAQAPLAVQATLRSARRAVLEGEAAAAAALLPELGPLLASEDAQEGLRSFIERRAAVFRGR